MSTTTPKPVTTPIPVQLSEPEFSAFILPHLSMPKRGPKCKLGYYRVFNLILRVLYTGMQWKCLPVPHDRQGKPAIHYPTDHRVRLIYRGLSLVNHGGNAGDAVSFPSPWCGKRLVFERCKPPRI